MAQGMRGCSFLDPCTDHGELETPLQALLMYMVAAARAGARIDRQSACGENVLPGPLARAARILAGEREGQFDVAASVSQIGLVYCQVLRQPPLS